MPNLIKNLNISNENMDKNKLFGEKYFFLRLGMCAPWKKFSQKIKNFEIFFEIIDNHTCVHMHVQKNFKIFRFLAKFLNFLEGPPTEFFRDRFFSTNIHGQTKFHWNFGCVLTFGLEPLWHPLCICTANLMKTRMNFFADKVRFKRPVFRQKSST